MTGPVDACCDGRMTTGGGFLDDFATLSAFGATERGGVHREAASDADEAQRAWFERWLTGHGLTVRYDEVGNQFGLLELVPGAPWVLAGSHLDSQPRGGRFDGAYGVLAAAYAVLDRAGAGGAVHNLAVVNWFNEEGSRFTPSMFGSAVFTGLLDPAAALDTRDPAGVRVGDRLAEMGHTGTGAPVLADVAAYAEIHIEQGRELDGTGTTVGLVADTWAARKYDLRVVGDQSHTGSTPMPDRRDALLGAAQLVVLARTLSDELGTEGAPLHTSVSRMAVEPNSPVTVAREVTLNLDLRSPDEALLARADALLHERVPGIEESARVGVEIAGSHGWGVRPFPADGVELARRAADELGLSHRPMSTVAGHDSVNLNGHVPTVMLFVPSVEGISHNERELTCDDDLLAGVALLTGVVRRLAAGEITGR